MRLTLGGAVVVLLGVALVAHRMLGPDGLEVLGAAVVAASVFLAVAEYALAREAAARRGALVERNRLFELATEMIYIHDGPTGRREVNAAWGKVLGYSPEELLAFPSLDQLVHPGDRERTAEFGQRLASGEPMSHFTNRLRGKDGRYRWLEWAGSKTGDSTYYTSARDVTTLHHEREQLAALTKALARSNVELQEFAMIASHDLQEPLRKIQTFGTRLVAKSSTLDETSRDYVTRMQSAASRMQRLIEDLLQFARIAALPPVHEPVNLNVVVREVLTDLDARIAETSARIDVGSLPTLAANPVQLRQLVQNLVANALKFHKAGEVPVVRIGARSLTRAPRPAGGDGNGPDSAPQSAPSSEPRAGSSVGAWELTVEDEGIGFDSQQRERIFAPFHRLHGRTQYEGTGMGLAICRKIAESNGGSIEAHGTPGKGARFVVVLPVHRETSGPASDGSGGEGRADPPAASLASADRVSSAS